MKGRKNLAKESYRALEDLLSDVEDKPSAVIILVLGDNDEAGYVAGFDHENEEMRERLKLILRGCAESLGEGDEVSYRDDS